MLSGRAVFCALSWSWCVSVPLTFFGQWWQHSSRAVVLKFKVALCHFAICVYLLASRVLFGRGFFLPPFIVALDFLFFGWESYTLSRVFLVFSCLLYQCWALTDNTRLVYEGPIWFYTCAYYFNQKKRGEQNKGNKESQFSGNGAGAKRFVLGRYMHACSYCIALPAMMKTSPNDGDIVLWV